MLTWEMLNDFDQKLITLNCIASEIVSNSSEKEIIDRKFDELYSMWEEICKKGMEQAANERN